MAPNLEAGEPVGAVLVFRDISEHKRLAELTHQAFHDSLTGLPNRRQFLSDPTNALERSRQDGARHAVLFADIDRFKVINDSLGHSAGDLFLISVAEKLREALRPGDKLARLGGDFLSSEDVELLESLASYIGIALQNASLYARLEEKIGEFERLKEFNENIVESINVGILALDLDDRIESWNAQMEAMYALSRAEAVGQELRAVFPSDFIDAMDSFRNEQGVHHLYKFRLTTRAGEQRTANIAIAPLLSRDFISVGRIILVDDITERVSLETQLAQADKLSSIGLLAAGVAHEINTPLAVISSYAQMLSKQLKGDARLGPVLDKITQQSFRAAEIANGLLNFSRTSTTEFRDTDLNLVIRDTLSLLDHQFKTAQIIVDLQLTEQLPPILGNPGKLQQVFLNLLLNAKEAMPGGGHLRVATQVAMPDGHDHYVAALVCDSGSGIEPENLKRIYDPFFTTKTTAKPGDRRGTGLGLSVSYGIIQEHAGKIHVESAIGAGTTFQLEFPLLRNSVHA